MKIAHHNGEKPAFYFYRDSNQLEVDLLKEKAIGFELTEIKANRTFNKKMLSSLNKVSSLMKRPVNKKIIYGGDQKFEFQEASVVPWFDI